MSGFTVGSATKDEETDMLFHHVNNECPMKLQHLPVALDQARSNAN